MLEVIEISSPIEQDLVVAYGDRNITFELRWNDTLSYWYLNIKENNEYIAAGISFTSVNTNLLYDKYELGKLYLIDTASNPNQPYTKADLGKRLALTRDYA